MDEGMEDPGQYWDKRFKVEGRIWGDSPSKTARIAVKLFQNSNVKSILVPGAGYGRHTRFFSAHGFDVTGIEISPLACQMAGEFDPQSCFFNASALNMSFDTNKYDAAYCFNTLHLFLEKDRLELIRQCENKLSSHGLMFFTVFSEKDSSFGDGKKVEENTFESRPGRPAHYFTRGDLMVHFAKYSLVKIGMINDPENHGGKPHTHLLRYICVRT
jgi:SAM-dependent methyltransferase